ncbi:HEPN domain-containing protein [Fictibacillus sp. KU28468]|uniref:HEPN domain-containing protein n=1 Tax=Fictibacillus sp. KU28468 TaxID=2991053 RepID=UPI00223CA508|nr:HEPN domain-containing protein [Fictibacillus sp. KU28468]UZJ78610.1 HEPN domain-containing protein [Fictibacillus sp. KU28468]
MNKNKFKLVLIEIVKDLKNNAISEFYTNGRHKIIHDCAIHTTVLEINSFVKGLELFLKEKSLNENLAKKTIVMRYIKILKQLLDTETPSKIVTALLTELEDEVSLKKEFKVYVPLKGLLLFDKQSFYINSNCKIIHLDKLIASEIIPDKEIKEFFPTSIEHTVNAADFLKAIEIGVELSKLIVHFLRFIDYQGWNEELLGLRLPGYGAQMEELRIIAVPCVPGTFSSYNWRLKEAQDEDLEIDDSFIEDAKEVGLERFGEILKKFMINDLNDMEVQILRSIVWFGESKIEHDNAARFLKLTLVLECLLNLSKEEPVAVSLSERIAFIFETTLEERLKLVNKIKELYDVRSKIVHNGSAEVEEQSLVELEHIVSELIILFLTNPDYLAIKTKNELKSKLNIIKFS